MVNGQEIERARKLAGWSQKDLATRVGVSERTIGNWERDKVQPGMKEPQLLELLTPYLANARSDFELDGVSDLDLLAEVARRMSRGSKTKEVAGDGDDLAKKRAELEVERQKLSEERARLEPLAGLDPIRGRDQPAGESEGDAP